MADENLKLPSNGQFVDERLGGFDNIFLVPIWDRYIIYEPLRSSITLVTENEKGQVDHLLKEDFSVADQLGACDQVKMEVDLPAEKNTWKPTSLTFSNTQKCTLRCNYCYADGGRLDDAVIPKQIVDQALDLIIRNSIDTDFKQPSINFLGEGEATADWKSFKYIIESFRKKCNKNNLVPHVALSTNGVFSAKRIDYIEKSVDQITFSVDGLRHAHDKNRVLPNGKGSFAKVLAVMSEFDKRSIDYDIRCTATVSSTKMLPEFVEFVGKTLKTKEIHIEPVFDVSQVSLTIDPVAEPAALYFVKKFRLARQIGAKYQIDLYYSGSDLSVRQSFCGASDARNMVVTSKGIVTSCNEVLREDDSRSNIFQYGKWNPSRRKFDIDQEKINGLRSIKVDNIDKCQGCFAKYNCAGDCYAKTQALHGDIFTKNYTERCVVTRELTRDNLLIEVLNNIHAEAEESIAS